jgi:hypothetical protein
VEGQPGVPAAGLPDCERAPAEVPSPLTWDDLKGLGLPVPEHYDAPAVGIVEENARLKLQVVRLGEVLLASCACEPQMDLVRNLETRLDAVAGNIDDGYDWRSRCSPSAPGRSACSFGSGALEVPDEDLGRMQGQVHNDARGWDDPANLLWANAEPADVASIKGNFTRTELSPAEGYRLPIALGHTSDYNGYTVSYREYQSRESYRKALTSYGPHTADYMVTRLVRMAGALKGGPAFELTPEETARAAADEARQENVVAAKRVMSLGCDSTAASPRSSGRAAVQASRAADAAAPIAMAVASWRASSTAASGAINEGVRPDPPLSERASATRALFMWSAVCGP